MEQEDINIYLSKYNPETQVCVCFQMSTLKIKVLNIMMLSFPNFHAFKKKYKIFKILCH